MDGKSSFIINHLWNGLGLVMELHPTIHDDGVNSTFHRRVTLTCKYRAPEPLTILFYHEGHEQWPPKYYNESRLHKDGWHGQHVWHTVWDTRRQGEIYECHTVTEKGFTLGVLTTSLPEPGSSSYTKVLWSFVVYVLHRLLHRRFIQTIL